MRRTSLLTAVFSLVLAVLGPAAWAAGEGTVPAGISQDPFTRVVRDQHPVAKLRVGITYDRTLIHLGARSGPVRLWIGRPKGNFVAKIPGGKTWTVRSTGKGFAIRDHTGDLVGGKVWGGTAFDLFATYADTGSRVFVKEADAVNGIGYAYNRGFLEFNLYRGGGS